MGSYLPLTLGNSRGILRVSAGSVHSQLPLTKLLKQVTKCERDFRMSKTLPHPQISQFDFYAKSF